MKMLLILALMFSPLSSLAQSSIQAEGDYDVNLKEAECMLVYMAGVSIWRVAITTPTMTYKKTGVTSDVMLFFSKDFTPKPGTFPIAFSYLNKKDTLGASFKSRKMKTRSKRLSHDTEGTITFTRFDDVMEGTYSFTVYEGSKDPRKKAILKGTFRTQVLPGFPGKPPAK